MSYYPVTQDTWFIVFFFGGAAVAFWGGYQLGKEYRQPRDEKGRYLAK